MNLESIYERFFDSPKKLVVGETVASQLPGRQNGGAADAYRHILLSAELARRFGTRIALSRLNRHESIEANGADNGLDMWNNAIGIRIGDYVRKKDGDWKDIVRLSRAVMAHAFDGPGFEQVGNWKVRKADDGIRKSYEIYAGPVRNQAKGFEKFANTYNRKQRFRAQDKAIVLENGELELFAPAMTSPRHWTVHPKVEIDGQKIELKVEEAQFPTREWFTGKGFVYEDGNHAPSLSFDPEQFPGPGVGKGLDGNAAAANIAPQGQGRPRLGLTPDMQRLLSGDLTVLDPKNKRFSPNMLRFMMGGEVPRVKGATRLHDIARPQSDRFEP
ncbi:hypothetical protein [Hoeflea poritis]|uniref:Uncharacterized protein n=1 Tax=Hoeflea poritis TaxID=2993659 RepID=A0ABT4VSU9_9HYPH|nr:hypothetical protein [Hoeflea poritis]MDA4847147.1 hypothetical protein [Hoeflea poritis]